nr:XK-related protein 9 isoform X1 [Pogona vitticeps]XP_020668285.1 XK-related protein 9 isoform X1 [Pogona vitticeps]XP_020668296.1 XK-related protein 9 isoform X1 [Pogona vitticeps]
MRFMKQDFVMMVLGIVVYVADVGADLWVAKTYFCGEQYLWCAIILVTGFISSVVVQFFSYIWFKEDNAGQLNWTLFLLHFLHGGIFTRYWYALKYGYRAAYKSNISGDKLIDGSTSLIHKRAIDAMADISMLRLFKTYLESTPQLILQIYILMTSDIDVRTFSQYFSITVSFTSISCATVDYQIALRKSLPDKNMFSMISSKITYFSYKLLTLTSWILSIALVTVLSINGSIILLGVLWLGGISWVLRQHTSLCKSKAAEVVYRIIVGIILTFTFFNVKGEKTKIILCVYYVIRVLITLAILCACMFCKSLFNGKIYLLSVIAAVVASLVLGIVSLSVYYRFCHPSIYYAQDVVDGRGDERNETCRIRRFLIQ